LANRRLSTGDPYALKKNERNGKNEGTVDKCIYPPKDNNLETIKNEKLKFILLSKYNNINRTNEFLFRRHY